MKDMFGQEVKVGSFIAYGKSDRIDPIHTGVITWINEEKQEYGVLGTGNKKEGKSYIGWKNRLIVLPDEYKEMVSE